MWKFLSAVLLLALVLVLELPAFAQAQTVGSWQTLPYTTPVNPVHAALLHSGKVLIVEGSGNNTTQFSAGTFRYALWDPSAGTVNAYSYSWDMFCEAMVGLPDGRVLVAGGNVQYDPFFGERRASIFDPATEQFTDVDSMQHGRWYPTTTVLGDGTVMAFSGLDENSATNRAVEIFKTGVGWGPQYIASWTPPLYPWLHVLPNGNVFYSGPSPSSAMFNTSTHAWTTGVANTKYGSNRTYGSSVLLPLTPQNSYRPKVMILGGNNPATNTTEIIDLSASKPAWAYSANMSAARIEMNAVLLPNGKVLALGGSVNDEDTTTASLNADLFDPTTATFSPAGTEAYARLYHSVALLMPDATVWVAGGNPHRGTYEPHMEIYSPAYLFTKDLSGNVVPATRPTIAIAPSVVGYGGTFLVQTADAANISSVVLMRAGATTHAFDMDQRLVGLSFTMGSSSLSVSGPPNSNVAPPGYYLLFLVNSSGVPSVATFVQVSANPTDQPPQATITAPTSNVSIVAGQSVSFSGAASDPDGSIASYHWNIPGGTPAVSSAQNPGAVTFSTVGQYTVSLTVTDDAGMTNVSPPTRTVTVAAPVTPPQFSPGGGIYTGSVSVSITDSVPNAAIYYTVDGTTPTTSSTLYSGPVVVTASSTLKAIALVPGYPPSPASTAAFTIESSSPTIDYGTGFTGVGMALNGHASYSSSRLRMTDGGINEASSAFYGTTVDIQSFTTDFTIQLTNPSADGVAFVIQNTGLTALGPYGGGLGYGPDSPGGTPGIGKSVAVKFDLYDNAGEGPNSTGLYTNGASPTTPAITITNVDLHSSDVLGVHMTYDGTTLAIHVNDPVTGATFSNNWTINIPTTVGASKAYVGFTGGTGGLTATQDVLYWAFTSSSVQSQAAAPAFSPSAGTYSSAQNVTISDATSGATIYYTTDGTTPTTSSTVYSTPIAVSTTTTIKAMAAATGYTNSAVASATYTMQSTAATPTFSPAAGTYPSTQNVTISDATSGAIIYYTTDGTAPTTSSTVYSTPITVSTTMTIKAMAAATGYTNSAVASATYTIQAPDCVTFGLAANPAAITISRSSSRQSQITLTAAGGCTYTGTANFTVSLSSGLKGLAVSVSPTSAVGPNGTTTLTVTVGGKPQTGSATVTVTATDSNNGGSATVAVPIAIQ